MRRTICPWLTILLALVLSLGVNAGEEQGVDTPRSPSPGYVLPTPEWPQVHFEQPDPLLDRPDAPQPGFYTNVEMNLVAVHLRNQLRGVVTNPVTGNLETISFEGNPLNSTVMPRLELGYRLANGWGSLQIDYRFLTTQGKDTSVIGPLAGGPLIPVPPPTFTPTPANQEGRFDFNILDLTYVSQEFSLRPNWNLRAGVGFRFMTLYFDSRVQFLQIPAGGLGVPLSQSESNSFYGFGGWGFCDLERRLFLPGLSIFGRIEGQDVFARITQGFTETLFAGPGAVNQSASVRWFNGVGVAELRGILGLSYVVPKWNYSRFLVGYQYEAFFQIGRITSFGSAGYPDDRASLNLDGLLLRAEFNF